MPHQFYAIVPNDDGTVDIYLDTFTPSQPQSPQPLQVHIVKGIVPWDGLEDSVRKNYYSWRSIAQTVTLQEREAKP